MHFKLLAAAVMGAALTAPACALAAQVIETETINSQQNPYTDTFTLQAFNTSLGTLQSVEFVLTDQSLITVEVQNDNNAKKTFTDASASFPLKVSGPGGFGVSETITDMVASGTVAKHSLGSYPGGLVTDIKSKTFTSGLSSFESSSPLDLSFKAHAATGSFSGHAGENVFFGGTSFTGGTFEIIYNYAVVPEPATWAFLMLGVGAIGVAMRRRKAGLALAAA